MTSDEAAVITGVRRGSSERWRELLPAGRAYVALPSRERPVVVASRDPAVLRYLRTALLAAPPRSAVPDWVFAAARQALRVPWLWRYTPHFLATEPTARSALADLTTAAGSGLVVLRHSHDPDARTLLLLFGPGERLPGRAVKLPDGPEAVARVRAEADRLRLVATLPLGALGATVPELVAVLDHDGLPALVTTALPGTPMLVEYHRRGHTARPASVRADFAAVRTWLASFQSLTCQSVTRQSVRSQAAAQAMTPQSTTEQGTAPLDLAPGVADAFERGRLAATEGAAQRLDRLVAVRDRLRRHRAALTAVHGDLWPGNVLIHQGEVTGVVDWERSCAAGSPTRDLARFALSYSHYLGRRTRPGARVQGHSGLVGGDPAAAVVHALDGSGWYPDLVRAYLADGLARLGLPAYCGRDAVLAEVATLAAEATDAGFARRQLRVFDRLCDREDASR